MPWPRRPPPNKPLLPKDIPVTRFVFVGGGIIGTALALELARRKAGSVTVLEKETSLGQHASGRNSGVIHSGINQKPGSLKARMCVEGSKRLREYCRKRQVPMMECGTLVVARNAKELGVLDTLMKMGAECGVSGLALLTQRELQQREPLANGIAALFSASGATVDSKALLESLAEDARQSGVEFRFGQKVIGVNGTDILTEQGFVSADHVVNCAGLHADHIAHGMGVGKDYRVIPFRGEYMEVKGCTVNGMIYQPPDLRFPFLSIHLTKETDGRVLAGPSAVLAFGRESYEKQWMWKEMGEMFLSRAFLMLATHKDFLSVAWKNARLSVSRRAFLKEIQSLVPGVLMENLSPYRAGIRAQIVDRSGRMLNDMLVEYRENSTHVLNAVSPGMTCSLAFAQHVADNMLKIRR